MAQRSFRTTVYVRGLISYLKQESCRYQNSCLTFVKGKETLVLSKTESEELILYVAGMSHHPNVALTFVPDLAIDEDSYWVISSEEEVSLDDLVKDL